ncbi:hypothetical protein [Bacillus xiapuensis]|uniref:hypothetical protein n=1 Tax=Bacillus xiapuensis TaxID=2014075 RepID=UPI000C242230|nr:hypothetical protein [Bacillus xiapuensis]
MRMFLIAIMSAAVLSACGDKEASNESWMENEDGREFAPGSLTETRADEAKQDDPVNTNQNPNFLDLSPEQPTTGTDIDKARDVVRRYSPYAPGAVWVNGDRMQVTVHERKSERYQASDEKAVYEKLIQALPRYKIDVKVKKRS